MNILLGYGLYGLFIIVIISMILFHINLVEKDARKEERQKARHQARVLAEREFNRMVRNTEFKVTQTMVISNESDIEW